MIKRAISLILSLSLSTCLTLQTYAIYDVAIPQNIHLPAPPSSIQSHTSELSFKSFETKISNVFKQKKEKAKLTAVIQGTCGDNVNFSLDDNTGILTISGTGAMTNYGYNNTPFGNDVKTVVIENGVTSIGDCTFYDCSALTSVSIPDSVTTIGQQAFRGCSVLTSVSIPDSVTTIGTFAFCECSALTSVFIPDSVASISDSTFSCCSNLTSVSIGNGVTSIDAWAFTGCASLTSVTIPASVTSFGLAAFSGSCCRGNNCTSSGVTLVTYLGISEDVVCDSNVFLPNVSYVNVPWNYEGDYFCYKRVSRAPAPTKTPSCSRSPSKSPMATSTPTAKFTAPLNYFQRKLNTLYVYPWLYQSLLLD